MSGPVDGELASLLAGLGLSAKEFLVQHELPTQGLRVETKFATTTKSPARVVWIEVNLVLPAGFPETRKGALLRAVERTVHYSIPEALELQIQLVTEGKAA